MEQEIDWEQQWALYAPNFNKGYAYIDLGLYGPYRDHLQLHPGAGFGDCSHPTTQLTLRLMAPYVKDSTFIDIGCGSGILTLAALKWRASRSIGIDIDPNALTHAARNRDINRLYQAEILLALPNLYDASHPVIAINMISSEQKQAWQACTSLHPLTAFVIASGILVSQREDYLKEVQQQRRWNLIKELQDDQWLGFVFLQTP